MKRFAALVVASVIGSACTDRAIAPNAPSANDAALLRSSAGPLDRYVAMGTSVSQGWGSDGVVAATQRASWPAQLAALAGRVLDQPYISGTGCRAPIAPPLIANVRISGEPILLPPDQYSCSPLVPGIDLPTRNVAISSATTFDALYTTPETRNDPFYSRLYPLILPPNTTQLQAALRYRPSFVSVELGSNEVLGAIDGRAIPGVNLFPVVQWSFLYAALADTVQARIGRGVLVGLTRDIAAFPAIRRGDELWRDRLAFFTAFNVEVKRDCRGSVNLIVVPLRVPAAVAAGLAARARGLPAIPLSCTAAPPTVIDFILDPAEATIVDTQIAQMNAFIAQTAARVGFAHFELDALYGLAALKPPFSVVALMTTATPFTAYMSLDGIHPSALGQSVIASAAATAINARYGFGLPTSSVVAAH